MTLTGKEGNQSTAETAALGTAHILGTVLVQKYRIFIMGNEVACAHT